MVAGPHGSFVEHDLDDAGHLVPFDRPAGLNKAAIVARQSSHPPPTCTPTASAASS